MLAYYGLLSIAKCTCIHVASIINRTSGNIIVGIYTTAAVSPYLQHNSATRTVQVAFAQFNSFCCDVCARSRRRSMSLPMKSRPILLDMTATCASADLPSPTHVGGSDGGMTTLDCGVCEVMPTDPDWRHTPAASIHRPAYDLARSTTTAAASVAVDCYGDPASVGRTAKWVVDEDVECDPHVCWAAYHHHVPAAGTDTAPGEGRTALSSPTTSSFRPPVRTTIARTHVYEMPLFQS